MHSTVGDDDHPTVCCNKLEGTLSNDDEDDNNNVLVMTDDNNNNNNNNSANISRNIAGIYCFRGSVVDLPAAKRM
jgi:hypothetical protein